MKARQAINLIKTPFAFYIFIVFILIEGLILWGKEYRLMTFILIIIVIIIVTIFAWFKPENLLFDANAYQTRDFGSNKKHVEYEEISKLKHKRR